MLAAARKRQEYTRSERSREKPSKRTLPCIPWRFFSGALVACGPDVRLKSDLQSIEVGATVDCPASWVRLQPDGIDLVDPEDLRS